MLDFEAFNLSEMWKGIKENPETLLLGAADPFGAQLWGGILGKDIDPIINQWGGPADSTWTNAQAQGINTEGAAGAHAVAQAIAQAYAGNYFGNAIGGESGFNASKLVQPQSAAGTGKPANTAGLSAEITRIRTELQRAESELAKSKDAMESAAIASEVSRLRQELMQAQQTLQQASR